MTGTQIPQELVEETYKAIETARATGKICKGSNEVTKAVERGTAVLVAVAKDVSPPEIVMHLPALCGEKEILCVEVSSKVELGASAGLKLGCACVAITREGESKKIVQKIYAQAGGKYTPRDEETVERQSRRQGGKRRDEQKKEE